MKLHELTKAKNYKKSTKTIGRGIGSGKGGHTVGRGMNGQRARAGGSRSPRVDFEGGQNPISRRLPKLRGFKSLTKRFTKTIRLSQLLDFKDEVITIESIKAARIMSGKLQFAKIVKDIDKLDKKLIIQDIKVTESVKKLVEEAGGEIK